MIDVLHGEFGMTTLLRLPDVLKVTGLSESSIARLERSGEFPPRRKISARAIGWDSDSVLDWVKSRPLGAERGSGLCPRCVAPGAAA